MPGPRLAARRSVLVSAAVGIALSSVAAHAHHSLVSVYDGTKHVTIEGVVKEFRFVNPHPFVMIDVKDAGGTTEWQGEMDNRWELAEIGVTASTLKKGDRVIVTGSPARAQSPSLYVRRLDRPADGFQYEQVGSRPRIR